MTGALSSDLLQVLRLVSFGQARGRRDAAALAQLHADGLVVRGRGAAWHVSATGRKALLEATAAPQWRPYIPPEPMPLRPGCLDFQRCPSIAAGQAMPYKGTLQ